MSPRRHARGSLRLEVVEGSGPQIMLSSCLVGIPIPRGPIYADVTRQGYSRHSPAHWRGFLARELELSHWVLGEGSLGFSAKPCLAAILNQVSSTMSLVTDAVG